MPLPQAPFPGLVVRYAFLWSHEARSGREQGAKDRPCVIVVARRRLADGRYLVRVAPITHRESDSGRGIPLPVKVKRHLGLDADASWVILDEFNQFIWPGVDLRPVSHERPGVWTYGVLPEELFADIRAMVRSIIEGRRASVIQRDD
ncbi:type II toxin-antitoxin system PemK/MazF family toxin [Indioceanicola profundi]|uniref:type II toxin-antitoxin system PemK/MazF family toxin n=1 Tax=Indioceanicola profundi TaxID=2220096 RepID=UPI000E6ADB10|nr:type II toxin-antitoxin system PemK/MazF family toxin [Indioceanicola profundi]